MGHALPGRIPRTRSTDPLMNMQYHKGKQSTVSRDGKKVPSLPLWHWRKWVFSLPLHASRGSSLDDDRASPSRAPWEVYRWEITGKSWEIIPGKMHAALLLDGFFSRAWHIFRRKGVAGLRNGCDGFRQVVSRSWTKVIGSISYLV